MDRTRDQYMKNFTLKTLFLLVHITFSCIIVEVTISMRIRSSLSDKPSTWNVVPRYLKFSSGIPSSYIFAFWFLFEFTIFLLFSWFIFIPFEAFEDSTSRFVKTSAILYYFQLLGQYRRQILGCNSLLLPALRSIS